MRSPTTNRFWLKFPTFQSNDLLQFPAKLNAAVGGSESRFFAYPSVHRPITLWGHSPPQDGKYYIIFSLSREDAQKMRTQCGKFLNRKLFPCRMRGRRLGTTLMCDRYTVGITPRPGLVAYGDGRVINADRGPHIRRTITSSNLLLYERRKKDVKTQHDGKFALCQVSTTQFKISLH